MEQTTLRPLPTMPEIGHPEAYYAKVVRHADTRADTHLHEAAKVGQYITLAMDARLSWDEKLKYFRHALKRHCVPPPYPDDSVWMFYNGMADLVRQHAGREALRLACTQDDLFATRVDLGQDQDGIADEAEDFFRSICPNCEQKPDWFNEDDWAQIKMLHDQWI